MKLHNISIMGEGNITSGSYKSVRIMGDCKILGYIDVEKLSVMGTLSSESDLKAGSLSVSGDGRFGNIDAENIKVMGNARFDGSVRTNYIRISGNLEIKDNIKAQEIVILGNMEGNAAESETFVSNGAFRLGSMNANDIKVKLRGPCRATEIGGETIRVSYPRIQKILLDVWDILTFRRTKRAELMAESIEADRIYLENTIADSVKGNNIIIGSGCKIKYIEYKDTLYIDNGSSVENNLRI